MNECLFPKLGTNLKKCKCASRLKLKRGCTFSGLIEIVITVLLLDLSIKWNKTLMEQFYEQTKKNNKSGRDNTLGTLCEK